MVLTEKEKNAASKILNLLSEADVVSLAKTVTKGQIVIRSRDEAERAVTVYSDSPAELLRRKIVRRDVLFKFADQEHINVKPNDPKLLIIQQILRHLGSQALPVGYVVDDDDDANPQNEIRERFVHENNDNERDRPDGRGRDINWWKDRTLRQSAEDQEFAAQFTAWFYRILNGVAQVPDSFGTEHFFGDATLQLLVLTADWESSVERFKGAQLVVRRLAALVADEQLVLNANHGEDGVRGMSDPHGRRIVFACGTVHRGNAVLGLFEQQFGLVRDPTAENCWKICYTRLALSTRAPSQLPTLTMTQNMLTLN